MSTSIAGESLIEAAAASLIQPMLVTPPISDVIKPEPTDKKNNLARRYEEDKPKPQLKQWKI